MIEKKPCVLHVHIYITHNFCIWNVYFCNKVIHVKKIFQLKFLLWNWSGIELINSNSFGIDPDLIWTVFIRPWISVQLDDVNIVGRLFQTQCEPPVACAALCTESLLQD